MQVEMKGWVSRTDYPWMDKPIWEFLPTSERPTDSDTTIYVQEHSFTVEVPDGPMIAERVAGVRAEIQKVYARTAETVMELKEKENNLLALTNEVPAQVVEVDDDFPF